MTFRIVSTAFGWKAMFSILPTFRQQARFEVREEGLFFKSIDEGKAELVSLDWNKDKFKEYDTDQTYKISCDTANMAKIFKRFSNEDEVEITTTAENTLLIKKVGTSVSFDIRMLIAENDGFSDPPKVLGGKRFDISMKTLSAMIGDAEVFDASEAWFENQDGKLILVGKGSSGKSSGVLLENFGEEIKNTGFSFEYLKPFITAIKPFTGDTIKGGIAENKPLILEIELENVGTVNYFLAPRRG